MIVITRMEKPDYCWQCPLNDSYHWCNILGEITPIGNDKLKNCPLIEVKDYYSPEELKEVFGE